VLQGYNIILTDERISARLAPVPMILATGPCIRILCARLRTYTSINVRSAECFGYAYFAY